MYYSRPVKAAHPPSLRLLLPRSGREYAGAGKRIAAVRRTVSMMSSRGTSAMLSRAARMRQKLQSALEASALDIEDVSYQHAGHAAVKDNANETHFNIRVISPKFEGQSLVKRHRMVYDLLTDELNSGLHAISIVAKTPKESGS
uniref:BolA protein n=3 Tax=Oryza TaxID=4527 RepID=A0A0D3FFJ7_9ORYZ